MRTTETHSFNVYPYIVHSYVTLASTVTSDGHCDAGSKSSMQLKQNTKNNMNNTLYSSHFNYLVNGNLSATLPHIICSLELHVYMCVHVCLCICVCMWCITGHSFVYLYMWLHLCVCVCV